MKIKIKKNTERIRKFRNVKGNKELTFIMILPLQMFDHYTVSDQNQMSPVYLFIYLFKFKS
jgi:hypothetical protein